MNNKILFNVPEMKSARYVEALIEGRQYMLPTVRWIRVYLQNETVWGYWIKLHNENQFRLVEQIREIK